MSIPSPGPQSSSSVSQVNSLLGGNSLGPGRRVSGSGNNNTSYMRSMSPPNQQSSPNNTNNSNFLSNFSSRLTNSNTSSSTMNGAITGSSRSLVQSAISSSSINFTMMNLNRQSGFGDIFDGSSGNSSFRVSGGGGGDGRVDGRGSNGNFGSSAAPSFDISEFPSLGSGSGQPNLGGGSAPGSNRPNYGQLVKDSSQGDPFNKPSFDMNYNDFPALPGSNNRTEIGGESFTSGVGLGGNIGSGSYNQHLHSNSGSASDVISSSGNLTMSTTSPSMPNSMIGGSGTMTDRMMANTMSNNGSNVTPIRDGKGGLIGSIGSNKGIQTSKDGRVSNIPMGMVADQFGIVGLLTFIRVADTEPALVSLALGTDLTGLKLELSTRDQLYPTYPGPWSDVPLKPYEIDHPVPSEYLLQSQIKEKLAPIREKMNRYSDDLLFFLFYFFPGDEIQLEASDELYRRDWRYHKDKKIWLTRAHGVRPVEKGANYERGTYFYFDHTSWRRVTKEFHLDYERLENR